MLQWVKHLLSRALPLGCLASAHACGEAPVSMHIHRGKAIWDHVETIHSWVVADYHNFPYLYVYQGQRPQEEIPPHYACLYDPDAFVLFAEQGGQKVGMLVAIPLDSPWLDVDYTPFPYIHQIRERGFDPEKILYVSSFLMSKEARGNRALVLQIYQQAADLARNMKKTQICYFTELYDDHHPLKPALYVPPEPWDDLPTPFRSMGVTMKFTWPTLQVDGSTKECEHPQALYIQDI